MPIYLRNEDSVKQKAGYLSHKTEVSVPESEQNTGTTFELDSNEQYEAGLCLNLQRNRKQN